MVAYPIYLNTSGANATTSARTTVIYNADNKSPVRFVGALIIEHYHYKLYLKTELTP